MQNAIHKYIVTYVLYITPSCDFVGVHILLNTGYVVPNYFYRKFEFFNLVNQNLEEMCTVVIAMNTTTVQLPWATVHETIRITVFYWLIAIPQVVVTLA